MSQADADETQADALLRVLALTAGESGVVADTRFRELLDALAVDRPAFFEALGIGRWPAFRARLAAALMRQPARLADYANELLHDAGTADEADYPRLCLRRSALQYLLDDLAGTAVADLLAAAPLAEIDAHLARIGTGSGPVAEDEWPDGLPESHHRWWAGSVPGDDPDAEALRDEALALSDALATAVEPVLQALHGGGAAAMLAALRPRPGDAARVFLPPLAAAAEAAFATLDFATDEVPVLARGGRLDIHVAPAGMLVDDNALSRPFPGGYRRLAPYLQPQRVWVAWKRIERGETCGVAFDGLVWIDDHWAWFPKPYRLLRAALDALR